LEAQQTRKSKKLFKSILKLLVTFWAVWYVLQHIDIDTLLIILKTSDPVWLFLAFLAYNASKIVSSVRLNRYFRAIGVFLSELNALRLYYFGMFYNLFLPGGISGDGYKIYLLGKRHNSSYKKLFQATLLDRISGLSALLFLAGILFVLSSFGGLSAPLYYLAIIGVILSIPVNFYMTKIFFPDFLDVFTPTTLYAFTVQLLQLLSAVLIVWALPETNASMIDYLTLFLISSVVAVLPISIGGIGVRELTFLYGFSLIGGDTTMAVTFSLIFFVITALSSLLGAFIRNDFYYRTN
jgi:uncharacterized membrane protein YbhN (UPF0104 family)